MARVTWHEDARLDVDGIPFLVSSIPLTTEAHLIIKSPYLVRRYLDLLEAEKPRRIVELGVRDGGSTALMALAAAPDLLIPTSSGSASRGTTRSATSTDPGRRPKI
jgi:hypothetical protein